MNNVLGGYYVNEPTWFYLSFLLIVAVFFKFNRLWSVRNLDLVLLLLISPGLLIVPLQPEVGYAWLFATSALLLARLLADGVFVRRPKFEQNMNAAGMLFLCAASFTFLTTKILTEPPPASTVAAIRRANQLLSREAALPAVNSQDSSAETGPGSPLITAPVVHLSQAMAAGESSSAVTPLELEQIAARTTAILAHLAVILGLVMVGRNIYGDTQLGVAMAALYVLLPCTVFDVGKVNHVLPAALTVWAVFAYRKPIVAGTLLGSACGTLFFPLFLLPLWASFYDRRGAIRFGTAVCLVTAVMIGSLALTSPDTTAFFRQSLGYIEWAELQFRGSDTSSGFWSDHEGAYRIPVFAAFVVMLVALTIWPRKKTLTHVIAHSAAIVVATQFWYPQQGGVYVLWYLPLMLLVVFRPAILNQSAPEVQPFDWLRPLQRRASPAQPQQQLAHINEPGSSFHGGATSQNFTASQRINLRRAGAG